MDEGKSSGSGGIQEEGCRQRDSRKPPDSQDRHKEKKIEDKEKSGQRHK